MQPPDLGPVLHVNHALPPRLGIEPGSEFQHSKWWTRPKGGQFSTGDRGSVFTRWRQSKEFFSDRGSYAQLLDTTAQALKNALPAICEKTGVPEEYLWLWKKGRGLTAIGSHVPASRMREMDSDEDQALGQAVRIRNADGTSTVLSECENSIVSVLADHALGALRLYVLAPPKVDFDAAAFGSVVESYMP